MRLNPDCVRDILLAVEENSSVGKFVDFEYASDYEQTEKYGDEEVGYHINQCEMSGLLVSVKWSVTGNCSIKDISPSGHEFLSNIRSNSNWTKVKKVTTEVGSNSLSAIVQIATSVISSAISAKFGN